MLWGNLATTAIDEVVAICIPKLLLSTGGGWMDVVVLMLLPNRRMLV